MGMTLAKATLILQKRGTLPKRIGRTTIEDEDLSEYDFGEGNADSSEKRNPAKKNREKKKPSGRTTIEDEDLREYDFGEGNAGSPDKTKKPGDRIALNRTDLSNLGKGDSDEGDADPLDEEK